MAKDRDKDRDAETEAAEVLGTDTGNSALDNELTEVDNATDVDTDEDKPKFGWLEYDKEKYGIRRRLSAIHHVQISAAQRKKDPAGVMAAVESVLRHCLDTDYAAFEDAFNNHGYDEVEDEFVALTELFGDVLESVTGRPKGSPTP